VKTFKPGDKVASGITSVALKGHTPGHVGYQISSGKQRLFDIGDTVHSSIISLAKPDWAVSFDDDKPEAVESRAKTLAELTKSHELIFAPHFPFPGVGHILGDGDHFTWDPSESAN
jgi:glyoxylase-like metal-dependent hydrolase (beta-lactamase superfamily II)